MKKYNCFKTCLIVLYLLVPKLMVFGQIVMEYSNYTMISVKDNHEKSKLIKKLKEPLVIYSDSLADTWENWSWDCNSNIKSKEFVKQGDYAIKAVFNKFGGFAIGTHKGIKTKDYSTLSFFINGGENGGQKLKVYVNVSNNNGVRTPVPLTHETEQNKWSFISIPLKNLEAENVTIFKINISDTSGDNKSHPIYIDDIMLVK